MGQSWGFLKRTVGVPLASLCVSWLGCDVHYVVDAAGTYASLTVWNGGRSSTVGRRLDAQVQLGPVNGSVTYVGLCTPPAFSALLFCGACLTGEVTQGVR